MALPSGYKRLSYIESSGTQFINTNFQPTNNSRIVVDFESNSSSLKGLFGSRNANDTAAFIMWLENPYVYPVYSSASSYNTYPINKASTNNRFIYELDKNVATVDGTSITLPTATFSGTYPIFLLAVNNGGTADNRMASGKLYGCQIYSNGILTRNFIPALNVSTNKAGLYEEITGVFYGNAGSGNFTYAEATTSNSKVMINGTLYNIKNGRTRVSGTAYGIGEGRVLVGGTVYTIEFQGDADITVRGETNSNYAYVSLNGQKILSAINKPVYNGDTLTVYVSAPTQQGKTDCKVYRNNSTVLDGAGTYSIDISECKHIDIYFMPLDPVYDTYEYHWCYVKSN